MTNIKHLKFVKNESNIWSHNPASLLSSWAHAHKTFDRSAG